MDPVPSLTFYISKIHFIITLPSILWSLKWLLLLMFSKNILACNSNLHHTQHALQYYHCPLHDQPNNVQWTPCIIKLCSFLQPPDTSYTLSSNSLLSWKPPSHFTPHNLFISKQYPHAIFSLISSLCKVYFCHSKIFVVPNIWRKLKVPITSVFITSWQISGTNILNTVCI